MQLDLPAAGRADTAPFMDQRNVAGNAFLDRQGGEPDHVHGRPPLMENQATDCVFQQAGNVAHAANLIQCKDGIGTAATASSCRWALVLNK
ncbi:hypothetical protein [Microvirga makkahensis]|uniref:Uncharacterized protein n=1 Tax=Microvirga makkahensis TaxID=1128670 RepID=A0A7X3MUC5_9HYPH|nr:hypothetical protein [Microvirga makkahensis]MXQ13359.1 hypothetical protein [Microvirga makkahensis]